MLEQHVCRRCAAALQAQNLQLEHGAQREDAQRVFADIKSGGLLDFVAAWYVKAARYMVGANSFAWARLANKLAPTVS